jgi:hypothetical protein
MERPFSLNQVAVAALLITGLITFAAVLSGYSGLIEFQCSSSGCKALIDGRQAN